MQTNRIVLWPAVLLLLLVPRSHAGAGEGTPIVVRDALVRLIKEIKVPASQAGILRELVVEEGTFVKQGEVLGSIDDRLVKIDLELADIELKIADAKSQNDVDERFARKSLEVAESEYELSQRAVERAPRSISKTELDRLRLVVEQSQLSIEQAKRDLEVEEMTREVKRRSLMAAQVHLDKHRISAPFDGLIVEVISSAGEWLNAGDSVVRIIQLDRLRVEFTLDGSKHGSELAKRKVELEVVLPGGKNHVFPGKITYVSPEVQPVNGQIRVWAEVENADHLLRPGVHGQITILP